MTIDNDFNLQEMTQSQSDKYVTHNTENRRIAAAVAGRKTIALTDANYTLNASDTDGAEEWRYKFLTFTGTLTAGRDVVMPAKGPEWVVFNNGTGQTLTFKITGQTGVAVANNAKARIYYDDVAGDIIAGV